MIQLDLFEPADKCPCATLEAAKSSQCCVDCSAEALAKVDTNRLRKLVESEYLLFPNGAIADEIVYRLRGMGIDVDEFSIRPRVSELRSEEHGAVLVPTGARRPNRKSNSCAVLVHKNFVKEAA